MPDQLENLLLYTFENVTMTPIGFIKIAGKNEQYAVHFSSLSKMLNDSLYRILFVFSSAEKQESTLPCAFKDLDWKVIYTRSMTIDDITSYKTNNFMGLKWDNVITGSSLLNNYNRPDQTQPVSLPIKIDGDGNPYQKFYVFFDMDLTEKYRIFLDKRDKTQGNGLPQSYDDFDLLLDFPDDINMSIRKVNKVIPDTTMNPVLRRKLH